MSNPKGKTPSLISGESGKPEFNKPLRVISCKRCKVHIATHEYFAGVPRTKSSHKSLKKYCLKCFRQIMEKTKEDIQIIEQRVLLILSETNISSSSIEEGI